MYFVGVVDFVDVNIVGNLFVGCVFWCGEWCDVVEEVVMFVIGDD